MTRHQAAVCTCVAKGPMVSWYPLYNQTSKRSLSLVADKECAVYNDFYACVSEGSTVKGLGSMRLNTKCLPVFLLLGLTAGTVPSSAAQAVAAPPQQGLRQP